MQTDTQKHEETSDFFSRVKIQDISSLFRFLPDSLVTFFKAVKEGKRKYYKLYILCNDMSPIDEFATFLEVFYAKYVDPELFTPTKWPICVKLRPRGANYNNLGHFWIENGLEKSRLFVRLTFQIRLLKIGDMQNLGLFLFLSTRNIYYLPCLF